jgi:hypothetical protein
MESFPHFGAGKSGYTVPVFALQQALQIGSPHVAYGQIGDF